MKKLLKAILAIGMSLSFVFTTLSFMTIPILADESFPGSGYNVIPTESKVFKSDDAAYSYCQSHAWDLYYKLGQEIRYQVVYLGQSQYQATFYAYNYQDKDVTPTPTPSPTDSTTPEMSVKVVVYELNVRKDASIKASLASWSPVADGMVLDVYGTKRDADNNEWKYVKMNGQEGYVFSSYVEKETYYTGIKDTTPDANEKAFANGKNKLEKETRVFVDNASAVNYANNFGAKISARNGGGLVYYYVSYAGPHNYVIHFYR